MKIKDRLLLLSVLVAVCLFILTGLAPEGVTRLTSLWVGDADDTSTVTVGDDDGYIKGTFEVDGIIYADGGISDTTGGVTAAEIADRTERIPIPLSSVFVDGVGPITKDSSPMLSTYDNVGAIVYDNSTKTAEIQFPWYPDTNFTALTVNIVCTSDTAAGSNQGVDWGIWVHGNDVNIPSVTAQTGAALTSTTLDASEELVTLTLDATGIAAVTAGTSAVTVAVWNNGSGTGSLEMKKIYLEETRGQ